MATDPDTKLPEGKTCGDCVHFKKCSWLVQAIGEWKECDFFPSRFIDKARETVKP